MLQASQSSWPSEPACQTVLSPSSRAPAPCGVFLCQLEKTLAQIGVGAVAGERQRSACAKL